MPFGLGFFATAGAGGTAGSFDLLETQILSSDVASVTFSSLSGYASSYQHLQLRAVGVTSTDTDIRFRLNGDSGNNYAFHTLYGPGSGGAISGAVTSTNGGYFGYSKLTAANGNQFGLVADFLDPFETTKNKIARVLYGNKHTSTDPLMMLNSAAWFNIAAISSLVIYGVSGNINATSRFSLYGMKAA